MVVEMNNCDKCSGIEESLRLVWITAEDFKPKENEIVPKELYKKYDALCEKCYLEEIKIMIRTPTIVDKFGIAIRVIKDKIYPDKPFGVEFSPLSDDGKTFYEDDFTCFGGSVGMSDSYFETEEKALEFFNDIVFKTREEMLEKYPDIWVE